MPRRARRAVIADARPRGGAARRTARSSRRARRHRPGAVTAPTSSMTVTGSSAAAKAAAHTQSAVDGGRARPSARRTAGTSDAASREVAGEADRGLDDAPIRGPRYPAVPGAISPVRVRRRAVVACDAGHVRPHAAFRRHPEGTCTHHAVDITSDRTHGRRRSSSACDRTRSPARSRRQPSSPRRPSPGSDSSGSSPPV